jgi:hypothetical protein
MAVTFYRLTNDEYEPIGRVEGGEVTEGAEDLAALHPDIAAVDEAELVDQFDGPYLLATRDGAGPDE